MGQEERNQGKVPVTRLPTLPIPGCPGEPTTLLTDTDWIPPSVALPLALWEQRCGAISHKHCLALAPNWKCWKHRPSGNRSCTQHFSSCTFLQIHQLCTGCSLCLGCCSLVHLPGDLLVVLLVPAETPLTLRCPFKFPWAGEVTCPPLPGFPQPVAQASRTSSPHCPALIYWQGPVTML